MDRVSPSGTAETAALGFAQPEMWLVGVPYRPTASRVVWMYYVVDEAGDVSGAVRATLARANSAPERQARGGESIMADDLEVRRIVLDSLGHLSLDGPGDLSAAPARCGPGAAGAASCRGRGVPGQCRAHRPVSRIMGTGGHGCPVPRGVRWAT
ncbi:hypothetical protein [Streptomyces sp. SID5789]|uniref:hypothetical protein n=2 Tax=unclassified Streptomyces TaxID=2593676 RepID=UPI001F24CC19|nr:hypothetical protein [Streptomyces sp. SID5789]